MPKLDNAVWVTGAKGRVGSYLVRELERRGYRALPTGIEVDVCDLEAVEAFAEANRPAAVINCAAMAGRDRSQTDPTEAFRVNAVGARNVAIASADVGAKLVHLSTDDVYQQTLRAPVGEFDAPAPDSVYGRSKLAGEDFVRTLNREHVIVRSSWIYSGHAGGTLRRLLDRARAGEVCPQLVDQIGSPTSVSTYADYVIALMEAGEYGLFHVSCAGSCSRLEFARAALEMAGLPTGLARPERDMAHAYDIRLDNLMLCLVGFEGLPHWREDLRSHMAACGLLA